MSALLKSKPKASDVLGVAGQLAKDGYVRVDETFVGTQAGDIGLARAAFVESCKEVPADLHTNKPGRNRRYGNFVLHPWSGTLESIPPIWDTDRKDFVARYLQSALINPEHNGKPRGFAPLTEAQRTNLFLRWTINKTFETLPWSAHGPVIVGVHIIQLVARPGVSGISSPDALHRDGEPFTWAFLIDRMHVTGGENIIAAPEVANLHPSAVPVEKIWSRFTLENQFEGWVVDDKKVSHYVSPVEVDGNAGYGVRTILLIDYSPAIPGVE